MNTQERLTPQGHRHAEAFCLMNYRCRSCGQNEVIWNSRDGVTPFIVSCEVCGGEHQHVDFSRDRYAPDYRPRHGTRIFVDMTPERARQAAERRMMQMDGTEWELQGAEREAMIKSLADDWGGPGQPDLITVALTSAQLDAFAKKLRAQTERAHQELDAKIAKMPRTDVRQGFKKDLDVLVMQLALGTITAKDQKSWAERLRAALGEAGDKA